MTDVPEELTYAVVDCGITRVYKYIREDLVPSLENDTEKKKDKTTSNT